MKMTTWISSTEQEVSRPLWLAEEQWLLASLETVVLCEATTQLVASMKVEPCRRLMCLRGSASFAGHEATPWAILRRHFSILTGRSLRSKCAPEWYENNRKMLLTVYVRDGKISVLVQLYSHNKIPQKEQLAKKRKVFSHKSLETRKCKIKLLVGLVSGEDPVSPSKMVPWCHILQRGGGLCPLMAKGKVQVSQRLWKVSFIRA